ncbi:ubiquitin-like small modifier protein 1 [Natronomonas gomsonensis]|uniref:ubiquitin-like small modifier protein 1 n=1 Tax=Natronomonas gomsonensis TaxID=1046043 RepID=UPI0015B93810|nr:ubiquitin-like small modifier protein 1 [Natronomonas gomsonensis]
MEWRLFANLAEAAGTKRVTVEAGPGDTFGDAFEQLLEAHPGLRDEVLDEEGEIRDHIRVLRNDRNPFVNDEGHETVLEAGDELALFPPVSGGDGGVAQRPV